MKSVDESARWRVLLLAGSGTELLPGHRFALKGLPSEPAPVDVELWTRFEDQGLTDLIPRELIFQIDLTADGTDEALAYAGAAASGLAAVLSLAVNAFVPVPEPFLAFQSGAELTTREFWQREVGLQEGIPKIGRRLDEGLLGQLLQSFLASPESARLSRAIGQYHAALQYWNTRGQAFALAHAYMALEGLAPAAERAQREALGFESREDHAQHRGVDVTRSNWIEMLLARVRRDVICQGDVDTYDAARRASDGLEHGSIAMSEYRASANLHARKLLDYVRAGVLNLLVLEAETRAGLLSKELVDTSPLWIEMRGHLIGQVMDPEGMGESPNSFPFMEWRASLDDVKRVEDDRLEVSPRIELTMHFAEGVQFAPAEHRLGFGLNSADTFDVRWRMQDTAEDSEDPSGRD